MRIAVALLLVSGMSAPRALPVAGTTTTGTGNIRQSGNVLTIDQSTARLAIDWQSFNISSGESVIFKQPSAQSIALNRVLGQDPSIILGNLAANGQIFVLNPNGVLFGRGAQVDVGGLLASSLQLSVADFLAGHYTLSGSGSSGSVINQGALHAKDGGYIALVAPQIVNEGVITARLGTAALGGGQQVTLTLDAGRLLSFNVDRAAADALVSNKQLIEADGGTVIMSARAKDALLSTVVNNQGLIEARSVSVKDGLIQLDGGAIGIVTSSGTLDASGTSAGERGGRIEVTGSRVGLFDAAVVDASGSAGGGSVLIGGDTQGRNPQFHNAQATYVAPTASIKVDALDAGNGGKVVVWSDEMTRYAGSISARGGPNGGNGGSVETSGKVYLEAVGTVDAAAPTGQAGDWLLDPYDVTLSTSASSNGSFAGGVFTPNGNSAIASITTIQASLNGGTSVTVNTAGAGIQAGDITVANSIAKTAGGTATLTLNATNRINFSGGANLTSTTGALNIKLNAGSGGINNLQNVNTNGGALTFNSSGAATQAAGSVVSGSGTLVKQGTGALTLSGANTYTGATTISAGTLVAANVTALGTTAGGVSVANGATLSINNVAIGAEALTLNGTGVGSNGALTGTGTASLAGNIALGSASSIGTPTTGDTLTLSGVISGANGLTKLGAGTLVLSGNDTYSGTTAIGAGTLQLGAANRIANGSAVTVASGATFNLNSFAETVGSIAGAGNINLGTATLTAGGDNTSTSFAGVLSGSGALTKAGTGTTTLAGANTYTGATTISGGTLRLAGGSAIADVSAVTLANTAGVSLDLNGTDETIGSLAGGGTTGGNVTLGAGTLTTGANNTSTTYSGSISGTGGLVKAGSGVLTLGGANSYSGDTTISAGTFQVAGGHGIGDVSSVTVAAGATLSLNGTNETIGSLAGAGTVSLGAGILSSGANNTSTLHSGVISGTGGLVKSGTGTLTLSGTNTYSGATTLSGGTLVASNPAALGSPTGGTTITDGATLRIDNITLDAETITLNGNGVDGAGALTGIGTAAVAGPVLLATAARIAAGPAVSLSLNSTLDGPGSLDIVGAGTVTLRNAVGNSGPLASLTSDATTTLVVNGGVIVTSGAQMYNGLTALGGSTTLRTIGGGDIVAYGPVLESVGVLSLDTGVGNAIFANPSNDFATLAVTSANAVSLVDANALVLSTSNVRTLQALSSNLTLTGAITASGAGDAIVLAAAGNFINAGGSLNSPSGRWLVYSTDPAANTLGGIASDFKRYNCTFTAGCLTPGTTLPLAGNGLLYSVAPTLNVMADALSTVYGAPGSALTYSASGFIDGDAVANALVGALTRPADALSGSGNEVAGTYSIGQGSIASPLGYQLAFTGASYTIEPRALTISTSAQSRAYDGTALATVTLADNRMAGDALNANYTTASFFDRDVGTGKTVTTAGIGLSGPDASNYRLASRSSTTTADITPKPIIVAADSETKVYGSSDPTLSYAVSAGGLIGSDTLSGALTRAAGETVMGGPYAITQGSLANPNYSIVFTNGALTVTPATLTYVANTATVYQWTPMPKLTGTVTGFVAGDTLESATTGTLAFASSISDSNTAGSFATLGTGLTATSGDYVFVQAPGNATAFVVSPGGETRAPGAPPEAYSGGLASTLRMENSCAQLARLGQTSPLCALREANATSRTATSLLDGRRPALRLPQLPVAIVGSGLKLPADASAILSY
ncbi:MAG: autotransporter-associated beta strand repeat-containing protein [Steroidobacteraceae bacterium]